MPVTDDALAAFNTAAWAEGDYVADYTGRQVATPEAVLLARHAGDLAGPVLELGCGAGRLTRVLAALTDDLRAIDVSPGMVAACRSAAPSARVELADLRDLSGVGTGSLAAVVAANNMLDIFGEAGRRAVLEDVHRILRPGGLLLFSSHNRAHLPYLGDAARLLPRATGPAPVRIARTAWRLRRLPGRWRNRRRTRGLERDEPGYAIVNDGTHEHRLAMLYVDRDAQERQLADVGFVLEACLDLDGRTVPAGQGAAASSTLHYAARRPG